MNNLGVELRTREFEVVTNYSVSTELSVLEFAALFNNKDNVEIYDEYVKSCIVLTPNYYKGLVIRVYKKEFKLRIKESLLGRLRKLLKL